MKILRSLSGRLLLLTVLFVLIGEVLIYVPSIARFRLAYLSERLESGHLATRALEAAPNGMLDKSLEEQILDQAMVAGVVLRDAEASMMMLSRRMPPAVDATFDLREVNSLSLIFDAFAVLLSTEQRYIRVLDQARGKPDMIVEVVINEVPMRVTMHEFSRRILNLSLVISLLTATLVYFSLQWMMVRPMGRITANLAAFRRNPEDMRNVIEYTRRQDEIGRAQSALGAMQRQLRASLIQKTRLAALGAAMSKINHDLRNSLASAMIVSDSLAQSEDPEVRRVTPRLMTAIDRAVSLCAQTLNYAHDAEPTFSPSRFRLHDLVVDVEETIDMTLDSPTQWRNIMDKDLMISADRDQLFRALLNLGRNAVEAMNGTGTVTISARRPADGVEIDVTDQGAGLPAKARAHLFEPFAGSARAGGTGLGLAIVREVARLHGGDAQLVETSPSGTRFRLTIPDAV